MSSLTDCHKIENTAWKQGSVEAEFEKQPINSNKKMLYKRSPREALPMQLPFANVDEDLQFRPRPSWDMHRAGPHSMASKHFLKLYKGRKIEVMCSAKENMAWNTNQEGKEKSFVGYFHIFSNMRAPNLKSLPWLYIGCILWF